MKLKHVKVFDESSHTAMRMKVAKPKGHKKKKPSSLLSSLFFVLKKNLVLFVGFWLVCWYQKSLEETKVLATSSIIYIYNFFFFWILCLC